MPQTIRIPGQPVLPILSFEILYEKCPAAAVIADFQREKASKGEVVGIEQMDAHNLFPVLNNYIFAFENYLSRRSEKHPENKHVKDKIRQQLQFLRDKGYLKFLDRGKYRLT